MMRIFTDDGGCTLGQQVHDRPQPLAEAGRHHRRAAHELRRARPARTSVSSRFVEDGSFVRLGEVTLGYKLPDRLAVRRADGQRSHLSSPAAICTTWTKYTGYNPDVNSAGIASNVVMGVDYYAYPLARTFTLGISAGW